MTETHSFPQPKTRAGFVAIIGAPNAGKSTFLNTVLGCKLAIVTPKVQTTRANMRGILTRGNTQFIFVDTPGIYEPKQRLLEKSMVGAAWQAFGDADVALLIVDATKGFNSKVLAIIDVIRKNQGKTPVYLAFNKVDKIAKEKLLPLMAEAQQLHDFAGIFAISAIKNNGVEDILASLSKHFPSSPYLYDEDELTDMPMRLLAAEITREKAFLALHQELPYAVAVETVSYKTGEDGSITIHQNLLIEKDNQKMMVVGKGGLMIKRIGEQARKDLGNFLGQPVHLFLKVKVKQNWAESVNFIREVGLEPVK